MNVSASSPDICPVNEKSKDSLVSVRPNWLFLRDRGR